MTSAPNRPVALVTGASRGIGRAIAIALAGAGFDVAITARTVTEQESVGGVGGSLEATAATISEVGGRVQMLRLDLLDRDSLAPTVDAVTAHWGRLDVLVNNAIYVGPENDMRFVEVDPVELERRLFADLTAPLLLSQRAAQVMRSLGGGTDSQRDIWGGHDQPDVAGRPGRLGPGLRVCQGWTPSGGGNCSPVSSHQKASVVTTSNPGWLPPRGSERRRPCVTSPIGERSPPSWVLPWFGFSPSRTGRWATAGRSLSTTWCPFFRSPHRHSAGGTQLAARRHAFDSAVSTAAGMRRAMVGG